MSKKWALLLMMMLTPLSAMAEKRIISITGKGSVEYHADIIRIDFAVNNTTGKTVPEAKSAVDKASEAVVKALIALGVDEKDIHSPSFNIDINQRFDRQGCPGEVIPEIGRNFKVTLRDVNLYRKTIDTLVENGVTRIHHVESDVADKQKYENEAMLAAIENAKQEAKFLVQGFGARVGKIHRIGDRNVNAMYRVEDRVVRMAAAAQSAEPPYEFKPAPVKIDAQIHVEFEIQ